MKKENIICENAMKRGKLKNMFCFNCGNRISDEAVFCENCGKKIIKENEKTLNINVGNSYENKYEEESLIKEEGFKDKAKEKFKEIKKYSAVKTLISFLKKPLTTSEKVVENSNMKEILILASIFIGISIIDIIINSMIITTSYSGYFIDVFNGMLWRTIGTGIIAMLIVLIISSLITGLFLKLGNGRDIMRKSLALVVMCTGISSILGFLASLVIEVSIIVGSLIILLAVFMYIGVYIIVLMKSMEGSKDVRLILSVVAITVCTLGSLLILGEIVINSVVGSMNNMFDYYDFQ